MYQPCGESSKTRNAIPRQVSRLRFAEIRLIQLEFERPPGRTILRPNFPPATFPILSQSPIRIIPRRLPFSVLPSEDDTAIDHAAEIPLEVVVVRSWRGVALGVHADDEIIPQ